MEPSTQLSNAHAMATASPSAAAVAAAIASVSAEHTHPNTSVTDAATQQTIGTSSAVDAQPHQEPSHSFPQLDTESQSPTGARPSLSPAMAPIDVEPLDTHAIEGKKTGRPVHPLWAYFYRGEKRNRYHHHAFCIYCVARYGAEHVAPTRGVSIDMLRHVQKCTNCPRAIAESIEAMCSRNNAARTDRFLKRRADVDVVPTTSDELLPTSTALDALPQVQPSTASITSANAEAARLLHRQRELSAVLKRGGRHTATFSHAANAAAAAVSMPHHSARLVLDKHTLRANPAHALSSRSAETPPVAMSATSSNEPTDASPTTKRTRLSSSTNDKSEDGAWTAHVLQAAVASGLPLHLFDHPAVVALLQTNVPRRDAAASLSNRLHDATFVTTIVRTFAQAQLDCVINNNSDTNNATTLSLSCWTTRDLQQLVAFNLVNARGDAACVCVVDSGTAPTPTCATHLSIEIERVLQQLDAQHIRVDSIVADSIASLNAARLTAATPLRRALLVVPCMRAQLQALAGCVLTHVHYRAAVGAVVDIAAGFSTAPLQRVLQAMSSDDCTNAPRIPLPNTRDWCSIVTTLHAMLTYRDAIGTICASDSFPLADDGASVVHVPLRLQALVRRDNPSLWTTLTELATLLAPLEETYALLYRQQRPVASSRSTSLAHITYQLVRMHQQYSRLIAAVDVDDSVSGVAQLMTRHLNTVWQRFELPAMALASVLDVHAPLSTLLLQQQQAEANAAFATDAIAVYVHAYDAKWNGHTTDNDRGDSDATAAAAIAHGPMTSETIDTLLHALRTQQFPFNAAADAPTHHHPALRALSRLLRSVALQTVDVGRIVQGIRVVPTATHSTARPTLVELLLHIGFASLYHKQTQPQQTHSGRWTAATDALDSNSSDETTTAAAAPPIALHTLLGGYDIDEILWTADEWDDVVIDWRAFLDEEFATDAFDATTALVLAQARQADEDASSSSAGGGSSNVVVAELLHRKVPLEHVFVGPLARLTSLGVVASVAGATSVTAQSKSA